MDDLWISLGVIRWPLTLSALAVLSLSAWSASRLFATGARATLQTKVIVDAILFWGAFGVVSGVLGTLLGMIVAADSIERAGAVSQTLVWGGMRVAILSAAFGTLILAVASLLWFGMQLRWRMLVAAADAAA